MLVRSPLFFVLLYVNTCYRARFRAQFTWSPDGLMKFRYLEYINSIDLQFVDFRQV